MLEFGNGDNNPIKSWSDLVGPSIQAVVGDAVTEQMINLPINLILQWRQGSRIPFEWFEAAKQYITIPYFDVLVLAHETAKRLRGNE